MMIRPSSRVGLRELSRGCALYCWNVAETLSRLPRNDVTVGPCPLSLRVCGFDDSNFQLFAPPPSHVVLTSSENSAEVVDFIRDTVTVNKEGKKRDRRVVLTLSES